MSLLLFKIENFCHLRGMKISVKCFATLAKFQPENNESYEIADGMTIAQLIEHLGMQPADVKIIFINSAHSKPEVVINDGDKVGLFPAVGGG